MVRVSDTAHGGLGVPRDQLCVSTLRDIEGLDVCESGFGRGKEDGDGVKSCRGELNAGKALAGHVLVVTDSSPTSWPSKIAEPDSVTRYAEGALIKALSAVQKEARINVSLVQITDWSAGQRRPSAGDVLCFTPTQPLPTASLLRAPKAEDAAKIASFAASAAAPTSQPFAVEYLSGRRCVFVCAHLSRDKRCGLCGPVLADVSSKHLGATQSDGHAGRTVPGFAVGKVSHVGGHAYAGNVLVYDGSGLDWFGYVTPATLPQLLERQWSDETFAVWRGRVGYSRAELDELEGRLVGVQPRRRQLAPPAAPQAAPKDAPLTGGFGKYAVGALAGAALLYFAGRSQKTTSGSPPSKL